MGRCGTGGLKHLERGDALRNLKARKLSIRPMGCWRGGNPDTSSLELLNFDPPSSLEGADEYTPTMALTILSA